MGHLFSKSSNARNNAKAPSKSGDITPYDRSLLELKVQRDKLTAFQRRLAGVVERHTDAARRRLAEGNKEKALSFLRQKHQIMAQMTHTELLVNNIHDMLHNMEFMKIEQQVVASLKAGTKALVDLNKMFDACDVEKVMGDAAEAVALQKEAGDTLAQPLSQQDQQDIAAEMDVLKLQLDAAGNTPQHVLPTVEKSPVSLHEQPASEQKTRVAA